MRPRLESTIGGILSELVLLDTPPGQVVGHGKDGMRQVGSNLHEEESLQLGFVVPQEALRVKSSQPFHAVDL